MELKPLTSRQIDVLTLGKKHWSTKKPFLMERIKSFGNKITEDELAYFMDVYVPKEIKRIKVDYFKKSQRGEINTKFTPTDIDGSFLPPTSIEVGAKYHLSWAFKGAIFKLVRVDPDGVHGYVDNVKHKRKDGPMKIKLSDLRYTRHKSIKYGKN